MEDDPRGITNDVWRGMAGLGWLGLAVPEEFGGAGMGLVELALLLEEMGAQATPGPFFSTALLGAHALLWAATDAQKVELLPALCAGDLRMAVAFHEESAVWSPGALKTSAELDGSRWRVRGRKLFVSDASSADLFIVAARLSRDVDDDLVLLLVDPRSPGVSISDHMASAGRDSMSVVEFQDAMVDEGCVLGEPGKGWAILSKLLQYGAAGKCAEMVGAARHVLDMTVEYVRERNQFGVPVGSFQAVQHHCADMAIELQGARLLAYQAAWTLAQGRPAAREVALAKIALNEACPRICATAHQCHGAIGFTREHDLHLYTRRAIGARTAFGDSGFHRRVLAALTA